MLEYIQCYYTGHSLSLYVTVMALYVEVGSIIYEHYFWLRKYYKIFI